MNFNLSDVVLRTGYVRGFLSPATNAPLPEKSALQSSLTMSLLPCLMILCSSAEVLSKSIQTNKISLMQICRVHTQQHTFVMLLLCVRALASLLCSTLQLQNNKSAQQIDLDLFAVNLVLGYLIFLLLFFYLLSSGQTSTTNCGFSPPDW